MPGKTADMVAGDDLSMGGFESLGHIYFFGSCYRLYYTKKGETLVLLLCGGDKSTQKKDIEKAKKIMGEK
ncbi:MAG: hypothetical protein RBR67_06530 [Desulfobacterium sp.]|jgi:putative addiction module killer protein|nr:hypothetical protein [Desulfobacterium sp.]